MKPINTSTYTFAKLIEGGSLYVDKTDYFYKLVTSEGGQFFISRPRRFGKSLAISTLDAIFKGKKELFKGLKIYDMDYDWKEYPVIHIDFAATVMTDQDMLSESLGIILDRIAEGYGVKCESKHPAIKFGKLIHELRNKTGNDVVLLIDEYDKPLLDHMRTPEEALSWREYMDAFYQVIKGSESDLRFVFITGVTKFAKVSIFSKLNNITDITMSRDYSEMFGYTQDELLFYFDEYLDDAVKNGATDNMGNLLTKDKLIAEIARWYDGFKFSEYGSNVYNPVSLGQFMSNHYEFNNYWFSTGTPSFLMRLIRKNGIVDSDISEAIMSRNMFETFDVAELAGDDVPDERIHQMLYQTGYLTIKSGLPGVAGRRLALGFPNMEVRLSFESNLFTAYTKKDAETFGERLQTKAMNGDTAGMIEGLKTYFASFPYNIQIKQEKYYQSMVRIIFEMSGMEFVTEDVTNIGRIDGVLKTDKHLYIIEFKLNKDADDALSQIDEKKYADKYILPAKEAGQTIHKLGINFCYDKDVRNITDWREE